jgi:hypothetical protein
LSIFLNHFFQVLLYLDEGLVLEENILPRWTKAAGGSCASDRYVFPSVGSGSCLVRKMLVSKVCEVAMRQGDVAQSRLVEALKALDGANDLGEASVVGACSGDLGRSLCDDQIPAYCPKRTLTGGRQPLTGLKAWQSSCKRARSKKSDDADLLASNWPEEEIAPRRKRKTIAKIMEC